MEYSTLDLEWLIEADSAPLRMFSTKNLKKYSQNSNKMLTNKSGEIQVM